MRVVIDTNVLVSAVFRDGNPQMAVRWCLDNAHVFVSAEILAEYRRVLTDSKFGMPATWVADFRTLLVIAKTVVPLDTTTFEPDPTDTMLLSCAEAATAD